MTEKELTNQENVNIEDIVIDESKMDSIDNIDTFVKSIKPKGKGSKIKTDSIKRELVEASSFPLLTYEQEIKYGTIVQETKSKIEDLKKREKGLGELSKNEYLELEKLEIENQAYTDKLFNSNLKLSFNVAKYFIGKGMDYIDLVHEGHQGLLHACKTYDPSQGTRFSTYAVIWIKQKIQRALQEKGKTVRIPSYQYAKYSKVLRIKSDFIKENGRDPSTEELSKLSNLKEEYIIELFKIMKSDCMLDQAYNDDEDSHQMMEVRDLDQSNDPEEELVESDSISNLIKSLSNVLTEKELYVLKKRTEALNGGVKESAEDLAKELGVSGGRIRQMEGEARKKIGKYLKLKGIIQ